MSYHYYIKDETEKLLIDCGGSNNEDGIFEDFGRYQKFKDEMDNLRTDNIDEVKFKELTIRDLKTLFKCHEFIESLKCIYTKILACAYWYMNKDARKLEIVGEDKLKDLKGYKTIE
ncbi:MAG: hypothetical protein PHP92_03580 [Candidatus Nanoarchaeia archaeon]|nr:hypothetical protein [Candidatus Nanoarchaeia archaeon]